MLAHIRRAYTAIQRTPTDDLLLCPPLSQHGEQERKTVGDWHREAQFRLAYQYEEPHTAGNVQQQRYRIRWPAQDANYGVEYAQDFLLQPGVVRIGEGGALGRRVVPGEYKLALDAFWNGPRQAEYGI